MKNFDSRTERITQSISEKREKKNFGWESVRRIDFISSSITTAWVLIASALLCFSIRRAKERREREKKKRKKENDEFEKKFLEDDDDASQAAYALALNEGLKFNAEEEDFSLIVI